MYTNLKRTVAFVLVSVVVCLAAVLSLIWTMPTFPTTGSDQICLPTEDGTLKCGSTPDVLYAYLERIIARRYDEIDEKQQQERTRLMSTYDKLFWKIKPATKLTGIDLSDFRESDLAGGMVPVREWRHGRELTGTSGFETYGIRYRDGRLVVPVDGIYFVYSYIDLYEPCDPSTGKPNVKDTTEPIKHGLFKFNIQDEVETVLVINAQPHTISSNKYFNSYCSYVSVFAELKAGDELSVKRDERFTPFYSLFRNLSRISSKNYTWRLSNEV